MIKVAAQNYVKAESVEEFLAAAKVLVEKTNAKDKGCIRYELCRDVNDPQHFVMLEEWEDMASLEAHMKSEHFMEFVPKLGGLEAKEGSAAIVEKVF